MRLIAAQPPARVGRYSSLRIWHVAGDRDKVAHACTGRPRRDQSGRTIVQDRHWWQRARTRTLEDLVRDGSHLSPASRGGAESSTHELAITLRDYGADVAVLAAAPTAP